MQVESLRLLFASLNGPRRGTRDGSVDQTCDWLHPTTSPTCPIFWITYDNPKLGIPSFKLQPRLTAKENSTTIPTIFLAHMYSHSALNATVEAWIDHFIKAGGQTVIMPDGDDSLPTSDLVATPRQSNKRQRQASMDFRNEETTPRPPLFCTSSTSRMPVPFVPCRASTDDRPRPGRDQTLSEVQSTSTADTNGTSRSGRSSPRKKEVALRRTLDWPIARVNITELKSVPAMLKSLALDLKKIADGRQSLIPDIFRVRYRLFYSSLSPPATRADVLPIYRNP